MNDRKQHVLTTAKKLFLEKGFDATSIQEILNESNISKGTFYNYFSSKNECLIAILESGRTETEIRRQELLIGQNKADALILAKQISVRFQVTHDHNLLPIFEAIFHSGDRELRDFAEKHHLAELAWLSHRLTDIYGSNAAPHAVDCAIMLLGMLQQMIHVWTATRLHEKIPNELVDFTVQQIDWMMPKIIERGQSFFDEELFKKINEVTSTDELTIQQLLDHLKVFQSNLTSTTLPEQQYIQFLIDELQEEAPRLYLIESVVKSFRADFLNTSKEKEVQHLVTHILRYMENTFQ